MPHNFSTEISYKSHINSQFNYMKTIFPQLAVLLDKREVKLFRCRQDFHGAQVWGESPFSRSLMRMKYIRWLILREKTANQTEEEQDTNSTWGEIRLFGRRNHQSWWSLLKTRNNPPFPHVIPPLPAPIHPVQLVTVLQPTASFTSSFKSIPSVSQGSICCRQQEMHQVSDQLGQTRPGSHNLSQYLSSG